MPVTRAMSRQGKDDTISDNPEFSALPLPKPARSKAKTASTSTAASSVPKPMTKKITKETTQKESKTKSKGTKKATSKKRTTTASRRRGKVEVESIQEEQEQDEHRRQQADLGSSEESQTNTEEDTELEEQEQPRKSLSKLDGEPTLPLPTDDPDEMLDSFQRAPRYGQTVRFAPSVQNSTIPEESESELEEEDKLNEEGTDEETLEFKKQLQKFGTKFRPDGAVCKAAMELPTSAFNIFKTIGTEIEARFQQAKRQLELPVERTRTVPNTPLMKTLTCGVKRPHSPDTEVEGMDDESPIPRTKNAVTQKTPATSTPLPVIPQSFDFTIMSAQHVQKKVILETGPANIIDKKAMCPGRSPAKKPRNFDFEMTEESALDDIPMDTSARSEEDHIQQLENLRIAELPDNPLPSGDQNNATHEVGQAKSALSPLQGEVVEDSIIFCEEIEKPKTPAVPQQESKSADDSVIFCEEVIRKPMAKPVKINPPACKKEKDIVMNKEKQQPHKEPLLNLKVETSTVDETNEPGQPATGILPIADMDTNVLSSNNNADKDEPTAKTRENLVKLTTPETSVSSSSTVVLAPKKSLDKINQPPNNDGTFLVESPESAESFHDANATFSNTTTKPNATFTTETRPITPVGGLNGYISAIPGHVMNETITLNRTPTRSPDSSNNYNITLYEDFDEENKHRENKKIPEWASNTGIIRRELYTTAPPFYQKFVHQLVKRRDPIFPKRRPNFKLFGDISSKGFNIKK